MMESQATNEQDNRVRGRKFKVSLNESDSNDLKSIADQLGINESDVMRKGLQLMALYAKTKSDDNEDSGLILKQGDVSRELLII